MLLFSSNLQIPGSGGGGSTGGGGSSGGNLTPLAPVARVGYTAKLEIKNSAGTPVTLYYCTHSSFSSGGISYVSKITQPSYLGQAIDINSSLGGAISSTVGELLLANVERSLDYLETYIFEGGRITLNLFEVNSRVIDPVPVLIQTIEQAVFDWEKISIRFIDKSIDVDVPVQTEKFLGNNILPNGVQGVSDLKDKLKPIGFGRISNAQPVLVNSSKFIYMLSSTVFETVVNVFSNGAYLSRSANLISSLADMESEAIDKAPAFGYYTYYAGPEGTFIRINQDSGQLTYTAWEKNLITDNSAASVIKRILEHIGFTSSDYVASDFSYIDSKVADNVGIVASDGETASSLITQICESIGAWWGFDGNNKFRLYYFGDFSATLLAELKTATPIPVTGNLALEISNASYNGKLVPAKEITINYDKNWLVQDKASLSGIVPEEFPERANWLSTEFRQVVAEASSTPYSNAQKLTYTSLLIGDIAAKAEADRILTLLEVKRNIISCSARMTVQDLHNLMPCGIIKLTLPRFGLDTGNLFVILSVEINYQTQIANLILWG